VASVGNSLILNESKFDLNFTKKITVQLNFTKNYSYICSHNQKACMSSLQNGSFYIMVDRKENSTYLARIIFMMLFFVVLFSANGRSEKPTYNDAPYGLSVDLHLSSAKAVITDPCQLPVFQKCLPTSFDLKGFGLYNYKLKIAADNNAISQQFNFIEKTTALIKPQSSCRFYYHLFHIDTNDSPILS